MKKIDLKHFQPRDMKKLRNRLFSTDHTKLKKIPKPDPAMSPDEQAAYILICALLLERGHLSRALILPVAGTVMLLYEAIKFRRNGGDRIQQVAEYIEEVMCSCRSFLEMIGITEEDFQDLSMPYPK